MNGRLIFLLEEPSMKELLDGLLPRIFPGLNFQCVPHEGKSDLDKSIPRKLKAWLEPGVRFVVVRDNDNADCSDIKAWVIQRGDGVNQNPEQKARDNIDRQLGACGWVIQNKQQINLFAGSGVAVREYQTSSGPVDYL